jgi:teichuronic acid biosynthesis glycosyltransferase TuaC
MSSHTRLLAGAVSPLQEALKHHGTARVRRAKKQSRRWPSDCIEALQLELGLSYTVALCGSRTWHALDTGLHGAQHVFSVSESLRQVARQLGVAPERAVLVGNGVHLARFQAVPDAEAPATLGAPTQGPALVHLGGSRKRKGFLRVLTSLPRLHQRHPGQKYLIVGGHSFGGDWTVQMQKQLRYLALDDRIVFAGPQPPDALRQWLSAADVFVLSTRNERWANVFLGAMACGLPVVTARVGGNAEVVNAPELGAVVPSGDKPALEAAVDAAVDAGSRNPWACLRSRAYADANTWAMRIEVLEQEFAGLTQALGAGTRATAH